MNKRIQASDKHQQKDFSDVLQQSQQSRQKVFAQINTGLIDLYWQIGQFISHKVSSQAWGKRCRPRFSCIHCTTRPEIKGFSDKNLWRMKQFLETYHSDKTLSPLVRELPWTHNTIIFSRCKSADERAYYLRLSIKEGYSSREPDRQMSASHFERAEIGNQKLSTVLRELHQTFTTH
ncbi:MAG: DUF1016 N-terminal domain-containing protein [Enterobacterales bacterium]|nr:DUF1016 N-terminal domain-containing protein [Enterobacterales bacterium]